MTEKERIEIYKEAFDVIGDILDEYLRKIEKAVGKETAAYALIFNIIKELEIEADYILRP